MPKVSVIIATHSRPHLLPRAVESALAAGTDVEVIVVDDASTDETAEVCKKLEGIKYIRVERNQHTAGARNLGILAATAPYISFLDDDDWRLPGSFDLQISMLDANPEVGVVYGQQLFADQDGNILREEPYPSDCPQGDVFWELLRGDFIGCQTAVFRKSCLLKVGLLDSHYSGVDDWDIWLRIAELYSFMAIKQPVSVWRRAGQQSGQGSSDMTRLFGLAVKAYKEKWSKLLRFVQASAEKREEAQKNFLYSISEHMLYEAGSVASRRSRLYKYFQAVKCFPQNLTRIYFYKSVIKTFLLQKS